MLLLTDGTDVGLSDIMLVFWLVLLLVLLLSATYLAKMYPHLCYTSLLILDTIPLAAVCKCVCETRGWLCI
jgi:hypothetical protein